MRWRDKYGIQITETIIWHKLQKPKLDNKKGI